MQQQCFFPYFFLQCFFFPISSPSSAGRGSRRLLLLFFSTFQERAVVLNAWGLSGHCSLPGCNAMLLHSGVSPVPRPRSIQYQCPKAKTGASAPPPPAATACKVSKAGMKEEDLLGAKEGRPSGGKPCLQKMRAGRQSLRNY